MSTFFGKYRGIVSDVNDPLFQGRIKARVPDVLGGDESGWAMPCFAVAGNGAGFFALPQSGSGVWIEFEHGDPDYPIWCGSWIGMPLDAPAEWNLPAPYKKIMLVTPGGHKVTLDDTPGLGGIMLETSGGQKLSLTALGVSIDNGMGAKVALQGPLVQINDDGLQVM